MINMFKGLCLFNQRVDNGSRFTVNDSSFTVNDSSFRSALMTLDSLVSGITKYHALCCLEHQPVQVQSQCLFWPFFAFDNPLLLDRPLGLTTQSPRY